MPISPRVPVIVALYLMMVSAGSGAHDLTTLVSFNITNGAQPWGNLIQGSDGNFYGTTRLGGMGAGTVFQLKRHGHIETVHQFFGLDGAEPVAGLVQGTDGALYGTTLFGPGITGRGSVYRLTTDGAFSSLVSFMTTNGALPYAGALVQGSDGEFYGTTCQGGPPGPLLRGCGTAFRVTSNGVLTPLHNFDFTDGYAIYGGLVEAGNGLFYGTTAWGGDSWRTCGTVFSVDRAGTFRTLASFD